MKDQIAIRTIEDLNKLRNSDGDYVLANNLDFEADGVHRNHRPNADNTGFVPINGFTGTLDGGGCVIRNLYVRIEGGYAGLFGKVDGATITDLGIEKGCVISKNTPISEYSIAGGIVGSGSGITLTNCYVTGDVSGDNHAGGLVGIAVKDSTIENCHANGKVIGGNAGGIVGLVGLVDKVRITHCHATGAVTGNTSGGLVGNVDSIGTLEIAHCYATGVVSGDSSAGGLVGRGSGTITNCYATGAISSSTAGGLVGSNYGTLTIENCYATGDVRSKSNGGSYAGGLVGRGHGGTNTLTNCYATGDVSSSSSSARSSSSYSGGLVGNIGSGTMFTLTNSYWDRQTTGQPFTAGTGGTALTTAELKGLTAEDTGWDISIWNFGTSNDYPTLRSGRQ